MYTKLGHLLTTVKSILTVEVPFSLCSYDPTAYADAYTSAAAAAAAAAGEAPTGEQYDYSQYPVRRNIMVEQGHAFNLLYQWQLFFFWQLFLSSYKLIS